MKRRRWTRRCRASREPLKGVGFAAYRGRAACPVRICRHGGCLPAVHAIRSPDRAWVGNPGEVRSSRSGSPARRGGRGAAAVKRHRGAGRRGGRHRAVEQTFPTDPRPSADRLELLVQSAPQPRLHHRGKLPARTGLAALLHRHQPSISLMLSNCRALTPGPLMPATPRNTGTNCRV